MSNQTKRSFEFGQFRLEVQERQLWRGDKSVPLTPKVFDLLVVLLEHRGRLVEKEQLLKLLWPDTFVEEANLSVNVSSLRKALGDSTGEIQYIETVPKRGYRFVMSATEITDQEPMSRSEAIPVIAPPISWRRTWLVVGCVALVAITLLGSFMWWATRARVSVMGVRTIAVLPFQVLATDDNQEFLGLGMADALITRLSNIRSFTVRPTVAVQQYSGNHVDLVAAGRRLDVDALLAGSVQRSGKRIRVTAQLIRVRDGAPIWAEKFDDAFTNIFALQDSISERLAQALSMKLTGAEYALMTKRPTENTEAYQLYLEGQYLTRLRLRPTRCMFVDAGDRG